MRHFEFHKNERFELELASGESPGDVPVPLGCSWATLGNFEVGPKFGPFRILPDVVWRIAGLILAPEAGKYPNLISCCFTLAPRLPGPMEIDKMWPKSGLC